MVAQAGSTVSAATAEQSGPGGPGASGWKESRADRPGGKAQRLVEERVVLEDSGLILSAEAPLRVWFGVHNPGDAGMGLGIWLHVRRLQLPRKKGRVGWSAHLRLGQ